MTAVADDSWLDIAPAVADEDNAWLDIQSAVKLTHEHQRAPTMGRGALGKDRVWGCDGEYVYFRPSKAHEGTLSRHRRFLEGGDYTHVTTQDDVQIFKLGPTSPFKRRALNMYETAYNNVRRYAILAACAEDYGLFVDCLEEMASRIKSQKMGMKTPHESFAKELYEDEVGYVFRMIAMRRGPPPGRIDAGVQAVQRKRSGNSNGERRLLMLPPQQRIEIA